jgi:hypothetical protein
MLDTNNIFSLLFKLYFCTPYWKIGTHPKPYLHLPKNIETWWMHCYPFKITSEPFTTTIGPKPRTFQNSNEFWPNSSIFLLLFSFLFFLCKTDQETP